MFAIDPGQDVRSCAASCLRVSSWYMHVIRKQVTNFIQHHMQSGQLLIGQYMQPLAGSQKSVHKVHINRHPA